MRRLVYSVSLYSKDMNERLKDLASPSRRSAIHVPYGMTGCQRCWANHHACYSSGQLDVELKLHASRSGNAAAFLSSVAHHIAQIAWYYSRKPPRVVHHSPERSPGNNGRSNHPGPSILTQLSTSFETKATVVRHSSMGPAWGRSGSPLATTCGPASVCMLISTQAFPITIPGPAYCV